MLSDQSWGAGHMDAPGVARRRPYMTMPKSLLNEMNQGAIRPPMNL